MISTLGFDFILVAFLFIYMSLRPITNLAGKVSNLIGAVDFSSLQLDFADTYINIGGTMVRGSVIEAVVLAVVVTIALTLLIRKTKLGVMMRSSIENPNLALVLGINVDRVFAITWFIAGFIAGIAGFLLLFGTSYLKYITPTSPYDDIVVSVFAGAIVGGIYSVEGSIGGGFLIGLIEKLLVPWLADVTGVASLIKYDKVFSMFVVALTLLFIPQGLASIRFRKRGEG
jgi:branched-chain amino acid transport system permease protein